MRTLNIVFRIMDYLELHNDISFTIKVIYYQVKLLMFYNVQTTNLTFVGKV